MQLYSNICSYFDDKRISTLLLIENNNNTSSLYEELLEMGFRHNGSYFYKPMCESCRECIPIRIEASKFEANKNQRRTLRKNIDIIVKLNKHPVKNDAKFELFRKYMKNKHNNESDENNIYIFNSLYDSYSRVLEVCYYIDNKIIGISIIDETDKGLSSNYFFYDTDYLNRRLGVFSILKEIYLTKDMKKDYYYLGYYIEKNKKMSYKNSFKPSEIMTEDGWVDNTL